MSIKRPSRRTVLRGLLRGAVVSVALPPLECMFNGNGTAYACDGILPQRFGLYFWGNGNNPERWTPTGEGFGEDWQLSEQLAPLAQVKDLISVLTGFMVKIPNELPHTSGLIGVLTGAPPWEEGESNGFDLPSIDQLIAAEIGGDTVYRSLETGAARNSGNSWIDRTTRNPIETSPHAFFERVFGATFREPGSEGVVDPKLALRRSVLDAVLDDISGLRSQVSAADSQRLEQHFEGVRALELRLARLQEDPPELAACSRPEAPAADYPDQDGRQQISAVSRAMVDIHAMALACDQTRVFSHWLTDPVGNELFPGATDGHHNLTHDEGGDQPQCNAITIACIEEYAYLVQALQAVPEGDGTLLDNCAVLATSEVSMARTHSLEETPLIIAGSACGALRTGQHIRSYSRDNTSNAMLSVVRAMGILAPGFGDGVGYADQGVSELEG